MVVSSCPCVALVCVFVGLSGLCVFPRCGIVPLGVFSLVVGFWVLPVGLVHGFFVFPGVRIVLGFCFFAFVFLSMRFEVSCSFVFPGEGVFLVCYFLSLGMRFC